MTSRISCLVINARDVEALAAFWCAVLGWTVTEREADGLRIAPPGGGMPIDIFTVPEVKAAGPNRLHLDLRADGSTTAEELARLLGLGARPVDVGQGDVTWTVLADPEGNEFCLLSQPVQEVGPGEISPGEISPGEISPGS